MTVELAADNNDWSNKFWNNFCGMKEEHSDIDEVDGILRDDPVAPNDSDVPGGGQAPHGRPRPEQ